MSKLADLRQEYARAELSRDHVTDDPIEQFRAWFDEAEDAELEEPNAMTLATAATDGTPSARIVLLKGLDDRGFHFYTNYESRKGTDLSQNPHAALVFLWKPLPPRSRPSTFTAAPAGHRWGPGPPPKAAWWTAGPTWRKTWIP